MIITIYVQNLLTLDTQNTKLWSASGKRDSRLFKVYPESTHSVSPVSTVKSYAMTVEKRTNQSQGRPRRIPGQSHPSSQIEG
jgi:hypothetical protein